MDINERIANLVAATSVDPTPIEYELLYSDILTCGPHGTANPGMTNPPLVVLANRREAFFKLLRGQVVRLCAHYGHHPDTVALNEVTAWRLARALGDPWEQLAPTAVLRTIDSHGGALINRKSGDVDAAALTDAQQQADAAGFWDALIANQDRHQRQYKYDSASRRLGLIDHGFAFARPGDTSNASIFLAARRANNRTSLAARERAALEGLLNSHDLLGIRLILDEDRADALEARARKMLRTGLVLSVHEF